MDDGHVVGRGKREKKAKKHNSLMRHVHAAISNSQMRLLWRHPLAQRGRDGRALRAMAGLLRAAR